MSSGRITRPPGRNDVPRTRSRASSSRTPCASSRGRTRPKDVCTCVPEDMVAYVLVAHVLGAHHTVAGAHVPEDGYVPRMCSSRGRVRPKDVRNRCARHRRAHPRDDTMLVPRTDALRTSASRGRASPEYNGSDPIRRGPGALLPGPRRSSAVSRPGRSVRSRAVRPRDRVASTIGETRLARLAGAVRPGRPRRGSRGGVARLAARTSTVTTRVARTHAMTTEVARAHATTAYARAVTTHAAVDSIQLLSFD